MIQTFKDIYDYRFKFNTNLLLTQKEIDSLINDPCFLSSRMNNNNTINSNIIKPFKNLIGNCFGINLYVIIKPDLSDIFENILMTRMETDTQNWEVYFKYYFDLFLRKNFDEKKKLIENEMYLDEWLMQNDDINIIKASNFSEENDYDYDKAKNLADLGLL